MKTKLMAVLFSATLFSAGSASAAADNFSYSNNWVSDSNYRVTLSQYGISSEYSSRSRDVQAEGIDFNFIWNKLIPGVGNLLTIAYIINEYGIPTFLYIKEQLDESQVTNTCERFYEYEDYWNDEMDIYDMQDYEESSDFEEHEMLSTDEYDELRDFCHDQRPRI